MKLPLIVSDELRAELGTVHRVERISVSIPAHLNDWVRAVAKEVGCSQSRVVEVALRRMKDAAE